MAKRGISLPFNSQALLLAAVEASGVSKGEFARRAGMAHPLLNRYLAGTHVMAADRIEEVLTANGFKIDVTITPPKVPRQPHH